MLRKENKMNLETKKIDREVCIGLSGEYQIQVVNQDGSVEYPLGEKFIKNVITNIGLDRFIQNQSTGGAGGGSYDTTLETTIAYLRVGSGSTAADATDTNLATQLTNPAPSNTNYTGTGGCLTTLTDANTLGEVTHKITKQMPAVTGSVTINELGLGWAATGETLFSRVVLGSPINLTNGQILRVAYQLKVKALQYVTASSVAGLSSNGFDITGTSPTKGIKIVGNSATIFGNLTSGGYNNAQTGALWALLASTTANNVARGVVQCGARAVLLSAGTFPSVGSSATITELGTDIVTTSSSYTGAGAGVSTKYLDRVWEWTVSNPTNTSNVVGMMVGYSGVGIIFLFDATQSKSNEYKLQLGLRTSWTRLP